MACVVLPLLVSCSGGGGDSPGAPLTAIEVPAEDSEVAVETPPAEDSQEDHHTQPETEPVEEDEHTDAIEPPASEPPPPTESQGGQGGGTTPPPPPPPEATRTPRSNPPPPQNTETDTETGNDEIVETPQDPPTPVVPEPEPTPPPPRTSDTVSLTFDENTDRTGDEGPITWGMWANINGVSDAVRIGLNPATPTSGHILEGSMSPTGRPPEMRRGKGTALWYDGNMIGMTTHASTEPERFESLAEFRLNANSSTLYIVARRFFYGKPQGGPFTNDHEINWTATISSDGSFSGSNGISGNFYGPNHGVVAGTVVNDTVNKITNAIFMSPRRR